MKSLEIKQTKSSPEIIFNPHESYLRIFGKSYMDYTFEFYSSLLKKLNQYFENDSKRAFTMDLELNVLNSRSSMVMSDIFDLCVNAQKKGVEININWHYDIENDMALELGEDYKEEFNQLNLFLFLL